jgi:phosphomannomutase
MNEVVVLQTAAGLAQFLLDRGGGAVVIGFDARHGSDRFARATARVMAGAGLRPMVLPRALPTPVLAFAIRHLGCVAGVMVTASHNPPQDNGYKVYLGDGSQIVPPADAQISSLIDRAADVPLADLPAGEEWITIGDDLVADYVRRSVSLVEIAPHDHVRVAYTPLHGVGGDVFLQVLEEAGFPEPVSVLEQFRPDPDFPTVAFPNPEEPGAMDLAFATAARSGCDLVIAHDPDADRCAVGVPAADGWRMLSGDEVGSLLAWWVASGNRRVTRTGVLAQSIVSGTMLSAIAEDFHLGYAQTLTGFKWIARVPDLMFGYEEALGYCVDPKGVRDKDGITAGLLVVEMATHLRQKGLTVTDMLDQLDARYGVHLTTQVSARVADLGRIAAVMARLRSEPPATVAGIAVSSVVDLSRGDDGLPPTDGVRLTLASGARIIVRPSGTEPKVKCYLQSTPAPSGDVAADRDRARGELAAITAEVQGWLAG